MSVRKTLRILAIVGLAIGATACGDRTVTTAPPSTSEPLPAEPVNGQTAAADASQLNSIDDLLRDIEADLRSIDQDIATPEGDPSE
jgi:hypothetical protein